MCTVDNFQRLRFDSLPKSSQESVEHKSTFTNLHLHEFVVPIIPIGTARLVPPSLTDELFRSEEDEDTSGTADTDTKQILALFTISFRGRKVLLSVKSVVDGGVKEDGEGVATDSPSIHRFIDHLIDPYIHTSIHPSIN